MATATKTTKASRRAELNEETAKLRAEIAEAPKTSKKKPGRGGARENTGGARLGAGRKSSQGGETTALSTRVLVTVRDRLKAEADAAGVSLSEYTARKLSAETGTTKG